MLIEELDTAIAVLQRWVTVLGSEVLDGADAASAVERFAKLERLGAAGRALAARRVAQTNGWRPDGSRSAADWVAGKTKTSRAQASASLDTAAQLDDLPATKAAFTNGEITEAQAAQIASAAKADPGSEHDLLHTATNSSMSELCRAARAIRAAAQRSQLEDRQRVHRSRYLRHWTASDGAFEARCRLTPDQGALLLSALDVEHQGIFEQARAEGRQEPAEAYRADALVNLARNTLFGTAPTAPPDPETAAATSGSPCAGSDSVATSADLSSKSADQGGPDPRPPHSDPGAGPAGTAGTAPPAPRRTRLVPTVTVRVDHTALTRGWTQPGEVCEITGIGPVPVETARAYARGDAVIRALLVDGEQVIDARNAGRTIPTRLRMALEERDRACVVPGCTSTRHLEIHHLDPFALGGETSLSNTCRICPYHHDQIT